LEVAVAASLAALRSEVKPSSSRARDDYRMQRHLPLAAFYLAAGSLHFLRPGAYEAIVPRSLPAPRALVYASGAAELAGGAGVLHPRTRRAAGWWLIATLIAIFPANAQMALDADRYRAIPEPLLWLRLPLQALLIRWAWRVAARSR
jgi:uncharacterized membrane protein